MFCLLCIHFVFIIILLFQALARAAINSSWMPINVTIFSHARHIDTFLLMTSIYSVLPRFAASRVPTNMTIQEAKPVHLDC